MDIIEEYQKQQEAKRLESKITSFFDDFKRGNNV